MASDNNHKLKKFIPLLSIIPFILGTIGYLIAGEKETDALYYSLSLYFVSLNSRNNNTLIEIARWTAVLVTTTVIAYAMKRIWTYLQYTLKCLHRDSIAVYSDAAITVTFDGSSHSVLYPGRDFCPRAATHIILLKTDQDSLNFYQEHQNKIKNKKVYIGLRELEHGLMKDVGQVEFFDVYGAVARKLWKSQKLWQNREENQNLSITIYGNDHLGQTILKYGLLLNLFSAGQALTYHVIGEDTLYRTSMSKMNTCNGDRICFHEMGADDIWDVIENSDLVIIAKEASMEELQTIGILCKEGKVCYYAPEEGDMGEYLNLNLHPFGKNSEIYTDNNIRRGVLIERAKEANYEYVVNYGAKDAAQDMNTEWQKLDGFLQDANISAADYNEIMREMISADSAIDIEMLAELEHIRWCRFHFLNHWQYGIPQNGTTKDAEKRIHQCLCAYSDLSEEEKDKDRMGVRRALRALN